MLNKITIMGRLTKEPELKENNGKNYLYGTVAVERNFKNKEGKRESDFFDFQANGGTAEMISKYFQKGSGIILTGSLRTSKSKFYKSEKGEEAPTVYLVVEEVCFTGEKKATEKTETKPEEKSAKQNSKFSPQDFEEIDVDEDDEMPF